MPLDDSTNQMLDICALRFDGYKYAGGRGTQNLLATLSERFTKTLRTSSDPDENHAAFFTLQRFLRKWGGEMLPESSREHLAFRLLFLHLYRSDIEAAFRHEDYYRQWQLRYAADVEEYAAKIREDVICQIPEDRPR